MVTNNEVIRQNVFIHARVMVIGVGSDLKYMFGYSKEPSHRDGSLSTRNMCFGWQVKK